MDWLAVLPRGREFALTDANLCTALRLRLGLPHAYVADSRCFLCGRPHDHAGDPYHVLACPSNMCRSAFHARHDYLKHTAFDLGVLSIMSPRLELRNANDRTNLPAG